MMGKQIERFCPRCGEADCYDPDSKSCSDNCILTHQAEIARLGADNEYLAEENSFLRVELTKVNNIIQPLWGELRERRIESGRNPQTGEAAQAAEGGEPSDQK